MWDYKLGRRVLFILIALVQPLMDAPAKAEDRYANAYSDQPSPCSNDMYTQNHVQLEPRHLKFFDWMFAKQTPFDKVYKSPSNSIEHKNMVLDGKTREVKFITEHPIGHFMAYVYAPNSFFDAVDLAIFNYTQIPSAQDVRFKSVSSAFSTLSEKALEQYPPEKIRALRSSAPNQNSIPPEAAIFIFIEDDKQTVPSALVSEEFKKLESESSKTIVLDKFHPEEHCSISRQREQYKTIQTYAYISKGAPPELTTRCIATAAFVNFGFSNADAIFNDSDLLEKRQDSRDKSAGTFDEKEVFDENSADNRWRIKGNASPHALLYDEVFVSPLHAQVVFGGQTLCQASDDFYQVEISRCNAYKEQNIDGSLDRKYFKDYVQDRHKRCKSLGIDVSSSTDQ